MIEFFLNISLEMQVLLSVLALFAILYTPILEWITIKISDFAALFSRDIRYKRWNGYTGLFYSEKPILTTKGNRFIEYLKQQGTDIHTEIRKARNNNSEYFSDETCIKTIKEIEPTEKELGLSFKDILK